MRAGRPAVAALSGALLVATGAAVSAHRYDEYLQASRIAITPAAVRLDVSLTPGIAVADAVIREVDTNRDAVLSHAERSAYAQQVVKGLSLRFDGALLPLTLVGASFPAPDAIRGGDAAITLVVEARLPAAVAGAHRLAFRNANAVHGAVYLANALMPADARVAITGMTHAIDQSGLTVAYTVRPARGVSSWLREAVTASAQ